MYEFFELQGGHRLGAAASAWSERQPSVDRRRVLKETPVGLTPPSLALAMRRAPKGPSVSQPSRRDLDRHRCLHRRHRPGAVFSSRRWKCGGTHAWLPMHARRRAVSVCMRSCALVHVRAHPVRMQAEARFRTRACRAAGSEAARSSCHAWRLGHGARTVHVRGRRNHSADCESTIRRLVDAQPGFRSVRIARPETARRAGSNSDAAHRRVG